MPVTIHPVFYNARKNSHFFVIKQQKSRKFPPEKKKKRRNPEYFSIFSGFLRYPKGDYFAFLIRINFHVESRIKENTRYLPRRTGRNT